MDPFCSCGSEYCVCIGKCCCCPSICRCKYCIENRNTFMCEECREKYNRLIESPEAAAPNFGLGPAAAANSGLGPAAPNFGLGPAAAPNSGLAPAATPNPLVSTMYPGVRFDKLPDLDFLNQRPSSGATGYSSSSIAVSKRNDPPQAHCLSCSDSSPEDDSLIFQMDDIDTSLPSIAKSSLPRSYSSPGSLQKGVRLGELPNETSRQLKEPTQAESTKYSPSKSPKSRESSPPYMFSVSPTVSPKKSPNCLSKSDTQLPDCPRSFFPDANSQLSTMQISPEIKTQSPCIDGKDMYSNSAAKPSDDEGEPDEQESSK